MEDFSGGRVVGIVCEYNPFHLGHAHMIERLRQNGAGCVVCVMSGPFVQRGEAALFSTSLRAHAAVLGGADLVFRLPFAWSTASAEGFARGAVGLLAALGCVEELAFGAETANTETLQKVATLLESEAFQIALQKELGKGESFAATRANVAETFLPGAKELLGSPNNILAVEYCKALQHKFLALGLPEGTRPLVPNALPRKGAAHDGAPAQGIASASFLRKQVFQTEPTVISPYVPTACNALYQSAFQDGLYLNPLRFEMLMLSRLRGLSATQIAKCPGAGEGLETRLSKAAVSCVGLQELYAKAKSKRFAHARVRRLALAAALELHNPLQETAPFLHLLAATPAGLAMLGRCKKNTRLPLSTSLAKLAKIGPEAKATAEKEALAEDLHALCFHTPLAGGRAYTTPLKII